MVTVRPSPVVVNGDNPLIARTTLARDQNLGRVGAARPAFSDKLRSAMCPHNAVARLKICFFGDGAMNLCQVHIIVFSTGFFEQRRGVALMLVSHHA